MKIFNRILIALFALGVSVGANAIEFRGTLTSLQVSMPGVTDLTAAFDPVAPTFSGYFSLSTNFIGEPYRLDFAEIHEQYHNINLETASGKSAVVSYPDNSVHGPNFSGPPNFLYNSFTRTVTLQGKTAGVFGPQFYCTGAVELCAGMYPNSGPATFDLMLILDPTLNYISSGAGTLVRTLGNGTVISYQYNFAVVPVPTAGWLLGSGLVGLAGGALRRRRLQK